MAVSQEQAAATLGQVLASIEKLANTAGVRLLAVVAADTGEPTLTCVLSLPADRHLAQQLLATAQDELAGLVCRERPAGSTAS